jgi:hypothetical protein
LTSVHSQNRAEPPQISVFPHLGWQSHKGSGEQKSCAWERPGL